MLKNQVDSPNFNLNLQKCEPLNASNLHAPAAVAKGQLISDDIFLLSDTPKTNEDFYKFLPWPSLKILVKTKNKILIDNLKLLNRINCNYFFDSATFKG